MTTTPDTTRTQTAARLAEIRARANAATKGPWGLYDDGTGLIDVAADLEDTGHGYRCRRYIGQLEADQIDNDPTHRNWTEEQDREQVTADSVFIAHAREDVPFLLDRVAELEAQVKRVRAWATSHEYRWLHELLDGFGTHGGHL